MGYSHWHGPYASFEERKKHFFQNVKLRLPRPASVHEQSAYYLSDSAGAAATKYHQLGAGTGDQHQELTPHRSGDGSQRSRWRHSLVGWGPTFHDGPLFIKLSRGREQGCYGSYHLSLVLKAPIPFLRAPLKLLPKGPTSSYHYFGVFRCQHSNLGGQTHSVHNITLTGLSRKEREVNDHRRTIHVNWHCPK